MGWFGFWRGAVCGLVLWGGDGSNKKRIKGPTWQGLNVLSGDDHLSFHPLTYLLFPSAAAAHPYICLPIIQPAVCQSPCCLLSCQNRAGYPGRFKETRHKNRSSSRKSVPKRQHFLAEIYFTTFSWHTKCFTFFKNNLFKVKNCKQIATKNSIQQET